MENSRIQWCDHTFNPWIGCSKVHAGCTKCYAEAQAGRHGVTWGPKGTRRKTSEEYWKKPLKWNAKAWECYYCPICGFPDGHMDRCEKCQGVEIHRPRVFCGSLCDVFEDWKRAVVDSKGMFLKSCVNCHTHQTFADPALGPVEDCCSWPNLLPLTLSDLRRDLFALIDATPNLRWILATKRPQNVRDMWICRDYGQDILHGQGCDYRANVTLLYSASDQPTLEAGIDHLLACRDLVPTLGLSLEPLVGPIDLSPVMHTTYGWVENHCTGPDGLVCDLDWVIVGGESGPHARPCNIEWIRSIVRCREAGVLCFVKQIGTFPYVTREEGGLPDADELLREANRLVVSDKKGGDPEEWPEDMRVREYPKC